MSCKEEPELKAGHPPAAKVGGMRVTRPHRDSGSGEKEEKEVEEEIEETTVTKPNPHQDVLIAGAVNSEGKAFSVEAVKHYHDKPHTVPTKEPSHDNKARYHIQQPR